MSTELPVNREGGNKHLRWYLLRWLLGPAYFADGLIITLTAGFYMPGLSLRAENLFLNESESNYPSP